MKNIGKQNKYSTPSDKRKIQVSLRSTETEIQTEIKISTRLVLDKFNLIDFKLGVGIVEIIR